MDKKLKAKANNNIFSVFNFLVSFISTTLKLIFLGILIIGAISAFLLYLRVFPTEAIKLYDYFKPLFKFLFNLLQVLIGFCIGILIGWLSFNIIEPIITKSKERREQRREQFLNDLANKMNKKLKKK